MGVIILNPIYLRVHMYTITAATDSHTLRFSFLNRVTSLWFSGIMALREPTSSRTDRKITSTARTWGKNPGPRAPLEPGGNVLAVKNAYKLTAVKTHAITFAIFFIKYLHLCRKGCLWQPLGFNYLTAMPNALDCSAYTAFSLSIISFNSSAFI